MSSYGHEEEERSTGFEILGIHQSLRSALHGMGIFKPSRHQHEVIKAMMKSESLVLQSKSGTGKTISFCIAIAQQIITNHVDDNLPPEHEVTASSESPDDGQHVNAVSNEEVSAQQSDTQVSDAPFGEAVIIAPTRELATQIYDTFSRFSLAIPSVSVILSVGGNNVVDDIRNLVTLVPRVLVATPGRLITLFKQMKRRSNAIRHDLTILCNTRLVVLDEADMLLEDHFIEQTKTICSKLINPFIQVVAVSATFMKFQFKVYEDMITSIDMRFTEQVLTHLGSCVQESKLKTLRQTYSLHVEKRIRDLLKIGDSAIGNVEVGKFACADEIGSIKGEEDSDPRSHHEVEHSDQPEMPSRVILSGTQSGEINGLKEYLCTYKREIIRIIVSASHVNRVAMENKDVICFTESDVIQDVHEMKRAVGQGLADLVAVNNTPVVKNIRFYVSNVPEAPNIVKQISVKLNVVVAILRRVTYRRCLLFCNQSHTRLLTASTLRMLDFQCELLSSRLSDESRRKTLKNMSQSRSSIIIAADIMSRGIHMDDIDLVINLDLPSSKEAFLHRSGRTGRYGKSGICIAICTEGELETLKYLEYALNFKCKDAQDLLDAEDQSIFRNLKREDDLESLGNIEVYGSCNQGSPLGKQSRQDWRRPCAESYKSASNNHVTSASKPAKNVKGAINLDNVPGNFPFASFVRETLISCIMDDLFPDIKHVVIPALGVIMNTYGYVVNETVKGESVPSTNGTTGKANRTNVRITECNDRKVSMHMSQMLHHLIREWKDETGSGNLYNIMFEQGSSSVMGFFNDEYNTYCSALGEVLITVTDDGETLQSLNAVISMTNVDLVIHDDTVPYVGNVKVPITSRDLPPLEQALPSETEDQ